MGVEASIVVEFGDEASESATVAIELDSEHSNNLDSTGELKSSFLPEDSPVFLIHHSSDVQITDVLCTHGTVSKIGSNEIRSRNTDALFSTVLDTATEDDNKVSTGYSSGTLDSEEWFGNSGDLYIDSDSLRIHSGTIPCYCNAIYSILFQQQWELSPPDLELQDDETYTIYVVIYIRSV